MKELCHKLLPPRSIRDGGFGESEGLARMRSIEMQYLKFRCAGLSTVTVVGLTMRGDEATDTLSALQIDSKHKQTRYSCNT